MSCSIIDGPNGIPFPPGCGAPACAGIALGGTGGWAGGVGIEAAGGIPGAGPAPWSPHGGSGVGGCPWPCPCWPVCSIGPMFIGDVGPPAYGCTGRRGSGGAPPIGAPPGGGPPRLGLPPIGIGGRGGVRPPCAICG